MHLRKIAPNCNVKEDVRFTDNGKLIMSGGISAGLDSSLYLVSQLFGMELAERVAQYMEYDWRIREPGVKAVFPKN